MNTIADENLIHSSNLDYGPVKIPTALLLCACARASPRACLCVCVWVCVPSLLGSFLMLK